MAKMIFLWLFAFLCLVQSSLFCVAFPSLVSRSSRISYRLFSTHHFEEDHHEQQLVPSSSSSSSLRNAQEDPSSLVHLLALRDAPFCEDPSSIGTELWDWKKVVVGHNMEVETHRIDQSVLSHINHRLVKYSNMIQECCVVTTCLRFELLLILKPGTDKKITESKSLTESLCREISKIFVYHMDYYNRMDEDDRLYWSEKKRMKLLPDMRGIKKKRAPEEHRVKALMSRWELKKVGVRGACEYLCMVSTGIQIPSMEDDPDADIFAEIAVQFDPYSSRNAHVMAQFKQCRQAASGPRVQMIMDAALTAGKKARNEKVVPPIAFLKRKDNESDDHDEFDEFENGPSQDQVQWAAEAALELAVKPTMEACEEKYVAACHADLVADFRQRVEALATDGEELLWLRQQMHQPTIDLRQGKPIDVERWIGTLQSHLLQQRKVKKTTQKSEVLQTAATTTTIQS
eukprot:CAMPEP_0116867742 /NCGR_PEP_ID=MMETSP0418-20121206/26792_1 /TAXON_ID=1158023 /ORGANISM="Astrosyne radiata, Strain 13vi08-1A" /LENGTH=457 /DNA_ID=CAMNT_0004503599 /DNA_START=37 /DNA_END=1413 /DNA_ORIENTATION=+